MPSLCGCPENLKSVSTRDQAVLSSTSASLIKKISIPSSVDPWVSSIMGRYIWNLSRIPSQFNIYFLTPSDTHVSTTALSLLGVNTGVTVKNWPQSVKTLAVGYANNYTCFIHGKNINEVDTSDDAHIVMCYMGDSQSQLGFYGVTLGPYYVFNNPVTVKQKAWIFINSSSIDATNTFGNGGAGGTLLLHELGHAFGICHPHDQGADSTIMPGVTSPQEPGLYEQNSVLNSIMSYQWSHVYLPPSFSDWSNPSIGYPETLMPYDYQALRLMYSLAPTSLPSLFVQTFGTPILSFQKTFCLMGLNRTLTVPSSVAGATIYLDKTSLQPSIKGRDAGAICNRIHASKGIMAVDAASSIKDIRLLNTGTTYLYIPSGIVTNHIIYISDSMTAPEAVVLYFRSITANPESRKNTKNAITTVFRDVVSKKTISVIQQGAGQLTSVSVVAQKIQKHSTTSSGRSVRTLSIRKCS